MMKSGRLVSLEDGSRYDLDQLEKDRLLEDLKEWDYPIFDLLDRYEDRILSAVSIRGIGPSERVRDFGRHGRIDRVLMRDDRSDAESAVEAN